MGNQGRAASWNDNIRLQSHQSAYNFPYVWGPNSKLNIASNTILTVHYFFFFQLVKENKVLRFREYLYFFRGINYTYIKSGPIILDNKNGFFLY